MEGRKQFTFYRSYFEAVSRLSRKSRGAVLEAIVGYGLDGTEPENLTPVEMAVFILARPTLDAGRKKAESGEIGGSKPKAKRKQTVSKKEKEDKKEDEDKKENEIEKEDKCLKPASALRERFCSFWEAYPQKVGMEQAWDVWKTLGVDDALFSRIMAGLEDWRGCKQWHLEGGRFIPFGAKWLRDRYFDAPPEAMPLTGAQGGLGQAELEAIELAMRG